jgi:hypothetical protein
MEASRRMTLAIFYLYAFGFFFILGKRWNEVKVLREDLGSPFLEMADMGPH